MDNKNKILIIVITIWVLAQVACLLYYWDINQSFDSFYYIPQAKIHAELGIPYPTIHNIYDTYLQAPGYINLLAISIYLTGSYKPILIIGILMNIGILINIYYLAKRFYGSNTAFLSSILYCLIPTNIFIPIWLTTELPYLFIGLTAFSMSLRPRLKVLIFAGILYGIAQTIRPIIIAFILSTFIYYWIKQFHIKKYVAIIVPYVLILLASGLYTKHQTGYFVTSSTVAGYDLMYTAYDEADGGQHPWYVFKKGGPGYIENSSELDFVQKEKIWKQRSLDWITENPMRYLYLCVKHIAIMYKSDIWDIPAFMNEKEAKQSTFFLKLLVNIPYYIVLTFAILSIFIGWKQYLTERGLPLLYIILGTGATCLFGMEVRYHYPYIFAMTIMAAFCISQIKIIALKNERTNQMD